MRFRWRYVLLTLFAVIGAWFWFASPSVVSLSRLPDASSILAAPDIVSIRGRQYGLGSDLSRDFMPEIYRFIPPSSDGKPLMGVVTVAAVDRRPFPDDLDVTGVFVVNGQSVWVADAHGWSTSTPYEAVAHVRGGPKWGPGIVVDVVAELSDAQGRRYYLKAAQQVISRTQ